MKVYKGKPPDTNKTIYVLLDNYFLPVEPVQRYIHYLDNIQRSPNTIKTYIHNLKLYWEFLDEKKLNWKEIKLESLGEFIHWLRNPPADLISLEETTSLRSEKTINNCLTTVFNFYEFHQINGEKIDFQTYKIGSRSNKYKSFLHHINSNKQVKTKLLKVKEPQTFPGCLTAKEVQILVEACNSIRDKFLIYLLYQTGLRIGEALGLRHEDLKRGENPNIQIIPRANNYNNVRAKSGKERIVHVNIELMKCYSEYLIKEYPEDIDCDFIFVVCKPNNKSEVGKPITYQTVDSIFRRLSKKTGIYVTPHLLRHTHATELIRAGLRMEEVQKRLGHADVQTTINTYVHLTDDDLISAYQKFLKERDND